MGLFSWMSSCGTVGEDERPSLVRTNYGDPSETQRAAAEDVARVEQDDRYFGRTEPAEPEPAEPAESDEL